jgi:hypothetical protein
MVKELIQRKCIKTGSVGAVPSGTALIPGLGTLAALTFGMAADISITFRMQTELVLEIAAAHQVKLSANDKQRIILLVTGLSAGTNQALVRTGAKISEKATERLAKRSVAKAIPVIGVAASAGVNVLTTYVIGRRAHTYFGLGEDKMGSWAESVRAISGVDEREVATWLTQATWSSWALINSGIMRAKSALSSEEQSVNHLFVDAGQGLVSWGKWAGAAAWTVGESMSDSLFWWRQDKQTDPPLPSDNPPSTPMAPQVVALIGTRLQSADEAQTQLREAQTILEQELEGELDRFPLIRVPKGGNTVEDEDPTIDLELADSEEDYNVPQKLDR